MKYFVKIVAGLAFFSALLTRADAVFGQSTLVDAPLSAGIVFDLSSSMNLQFEQARDALDRFVSAGNSEDEFFLIGFNGGSSLLADYNNGRNLRQRLQPVYADGATALYDAIYLAVEKAEQGRSPRRALLIISDGQDNASRYSLKRLRRRLKTTRVQVYCIAVGRAGRTDKTERLPMMRGRLILDEIARTTGGRSYLADSSS